MTDKDTIDYLTEQVKALGEQLREAQAEAKQHWEAFCASEQGRVDAEAREAALREALEMVARRFYVGHTSHDVDGCNDCDEAARVRAALATSGKP